jgi:two-component system, chemotaxis family, CheB/CheR fusion protein
MANAKKKAAKATKPKTKRPRAVAREGDFLVVGLGASAGGLAALETFFAAVPASPGMAFVVITHQHPTGPTMLPNLLARQTDLPITLVQDRVMVEPNHIYVQAPGTHLTISSGVLVPVPYKNRKVPQLPIDRFFRSLAADKKEHAVGIILSGTGSDGTLGLEEIKAEYGMVLAQDEASAQYAAMPSSAAATKLVDAVLRADAMPARLSSYAAALRPRHDARAATDEKRELLRTATLERAFALIRTRTGHDFSQYKLSTVRRRIERRMNVHHVDTLEGYVRFLEENPTEVEILFKELLIGVTSFFRDPEAWTLLTEHLKPLLASKPPGYVFRVWVPGCSTGQEAYTLAILLRELIDDARLPVSMQIFATDLDSAAIDLARAGIYPLGIATDVSPEHLSRFFVHDDNHYRIKQDIRESVVFAPQNVISDPPFTKLDLVSCRNLLIYLEAHLQKKLIPLFHYALNPDGLLFLGSSESIASFGDLFVPLDKKVKLFQWRDVPDATYTAEFPVLRELAGHHARPAPALPPADAAIGNMAERVLMRELVPPTVLIHERGDVVHIHGRTGLFLEPPQGSPLTPNIYNMAREGLQVSLAAAIRHALSSDDEVIHRDAMVRGPEGGITVDLRVRKLKEPDPLRGLIRISFIVATKRVVDESVPPPAGTNRVPELERELQYIKETQQSTLEQLETANEELKSTNEEMQSTNEELQSTNEELETSKEEMQSLNEELQTVNAELQDKVEELSRANDDMKNLLNATRIATIFLDNELKVKRYTEQAKKVIRLIPSDVGRSIGDLVSTLQYDRLVDDAREVLHTLVFKEAEVRGEHDAWYLMRILPYRTGENVIDGLVLTFVDITAVHGLQREQQRLLDALKNGSPTRVFGHDKKLRYTWASDDVFGRDLTEAQGKTDAQIFGATRVANMIALKTAARDTERATCGVVRLNVRRKMRKYLLYAEPTRDAAGNVSGIVCVATDLPEDA